MMAMSSWANGRNSNEKNCASHDESWSKKCSKADSASLTAIPRSDAFLPTGATAPASRVAGQPPGPHFGGIFIEASSLPLADRQSPLACLYRVNFLYSSAKRPVSTRNFQRSEPYFFVRLA